MTPETVLMDAVTAALLDSDAVRALVEDKILDEVPADRAPVKAPYVYCGPINRSVVDDTCATAWTLRMRLYVVTTGFGRRQTWEIADAVATALNGEELTLPDPFEAVGPVVVTQAGDVIAPPSPKTAFIDLAVTIQVGEQ